MSSPVNTQIVLLRPHIPSRLAPSSRSTPRYSSATSNL